MIIRATAEGHKKRKLEYDRNRKFKDGYKERDAMRMFKKYWQGKDLRRVDLRIEAKIKQIETSQKCLDKLKALRKKITEIKNEEIKEN